MILPHLPVFIRSGWFALLLIGVLGIRPVAAQTPYGLADYAIGGIYEEQSGPTGQAARDLALQASQRKAFLQLLAQIAPDHDPVLERLNERDIAALVESFQVEDERIATTRYAGSFTYRFRPAAIQALLRGSANNATTPEQVFVRAPVTTLDSWLMVRNRLAAIPAIAKVTLVSLNREQALIGLSFSGGEEALASALARQSLNLTRALQGWSLAPLEPASPPPADSPAIAPVAP